MKVNIGGIEWKNPVTTAAGTFIMTKYYDPSELGAVTTKGISSVAWDGNPTPRIAETSAGMLNAVGLQNKGVDQYISGELRELKKAGATVIANVAGHSEDEYLEVVTRLDATDVDMMEINVSCPNISEGGMAFGQDAERAAELTRLLRKATSKPLIIKLSPNVTDVVDIARRVEVEGADAVSLINTLEGMRIDIDNKKAILANVKGGLSGSAIKPVALCMAYKTAKAVSIPVIGMGGISSGKDAIEFFMAGCDAVAVGTAALIEPRAPVRILDEILDWMKKNGYESIQSLKEVACEL